MSDRRHAHVRVLALALLASAPLGAVAVSRAGAPPLPTFDLVVLSVLVGASTAAISRIILGIWDGHGLGAHLWVREPRVETTHRVASGREEVEPRLRARLAEMGFEHRPTSKDHSWVIFKGRSKRSGPFTSRPFLGFARLETLEAETVVHVDLRLMETILFETGEVARVRLLAEHLSLRDSGGAAPWSFALQCGFSLATLTALLSLSMGALPAWLAQSVFGLSAAALLTLVPGTIARLVRKEGRAGWPLGAIILASVPYVGALVGVT